MKTAEPVRRQPRGLPRAIEVVLAFVGLALAAPLLAIAAVAVYLTSPGPVLFRQVRVGRGGRPFELWKFRTMRARSEGLWVTARDDDRVTRVGKLLRYTKVDELPELWNILRGDMSFVGPRPEVPQCVDLSNALWQEALSVRPGLTDPIAIHLRNEEELLTQVHEDRAAFYLSTLQRYKLLGSVEYLRARSCASDIGVLVKTLLVVVLPGVARPPGLDAIRARVGETGSARCDAAGAVEGAGMGGRAE